MAGFVAPAFGLPDVGDVVNSVMNRIGKEVWRFSDYVTKTVFKMLDDRIQPTLTYDAAGPLGRVYPVTLWLGLFLAVAFGFVQLAVIAWEGGVGFGDFAKRIGIWMMATTIGLTLLELLNGASSVTAKGIISTAFETDNWQGVSNSSTFGEAAVGNLAGAQLALLSILVLIPFALGFAILMLIREGSLTILAATFPILVAGLLHSKLQKWFWTGLRWFMALLFMPVVIAIGMAIGNSMAKGVSTSADEGVFGAALVAGVVNWLSLIAPMVLFKLFAFVDPNTAAGANFRAGGGLGKALAGAAAGGAVGGVAGAAAGALSGLGSGGGGGGSGDGAEEGSGSGGDPVGDSGGGQGQEMAVAAAATGGQAGVLGAMKHMGGSGLSKALSASSKFADATKSETAGALDSLDAMGAGHRGYGSQQAKQRSAARSAGSGAGGSSDAGGGDELYESPAPSTRPGGDDAGDPPDSDDAMEPPVPAAPVQHEGSDGAERRGGSGGRRPPREPERRDPPRRVNGRRPRTRRPGEQPRGGDYDYTDDMNGEQR
ncbi:hypothetical protein [Barrientosiimonas humi]|uniref:hypothetical protein n=1 Tax=Barrientosiimonas humi TaxID=999931 RepID=UPI00370D948B